MAVWDDADFRWDPNTGEARSIDLVSMTLSDAALTEGTEISYLGHVGREYDGAVGSRFGAPPGLTPIDRGIHNYTTDDTISMFFVFRVLATATDVWLFSSARSTENDKYAMARPTNGEWDNRMNSGGPRDNGNDWAATDQAVIADDDLHVGIWQFYGPNLGSGFDQVLTTYQDTLASEDTSTVTGGNMDSDRLTIGRLDRQSALNSDGIQVFSCAQWARALTTAEKQSLLSDPFQEGGGGNGGAIAARSTRSPRYGLTRLARR